MILLIDNYDSFSYNLYQLVGEINEDIKVIRNDEMTIDEIIKLSPEKIIISPGPGCPADAGICVELIKNIYTKIPVLGVCLGHQAICEAFGATVTYAEKLMHGKSSVIEIENNYIFKGLDKKITVARYHSLAAKKDTIPEELIVTAISDEGEVMAVRHKDYPVYGVQFHPESILTPCGKTIIENFMRSDIL